MISNEGWQLGERKRRGGSSNTDVCNQLVYLFPWLAEPTCSYPTASGAD